MERKITKEIHIGDKAIGGGNPIPIQSMTNTKTEDVDATVAQIRQLTQAGCDIIRCAVPTMEAACALEEIKSRWRSRSLQTFILTIVLRSQPWSMVRTKSASIQATSGHGSYQGSRGCKAKERNIPIRVGVNSGSLEKRTGRKIPRRYGGRHCGERTG